MFLTIVVRKPGALTPTTIFFNLKLCNNELRNWSLFAIRSLFFFQMMEGALLY